jgi:hypothetical protein
MMGMQTAPVQLFYDFCLDDHVPEDHLLRRLDLEKRTGIEAELASLDDAVDGQRPAA